MKQEWSIDPVEFQAMAEPGPETFELSETVIEAVESLPKELRDIANVIWWERLTHPQAMQALNLGPATYYRRLAQTKAALYEALQHIYEVGEVPAVE